MLNISEIVSNKINSMLEDGVLKKEIEDTIEKNAISMIKDSVGNWEIKRLFEEKIKNEVHEAVNNISFKGYANMVIQNLKKSVEAHAENAITEDVLNYFNDLYLPPENQILTVKDIFKKYVEMAKDEDPSEYDYEDKYAFMSVQEESGHYSRWVKILVSLDEEYKDEDAKTYEISLINESENKFRICSIYEDRKYSKNMTERVKTGMENNKIKYEQCNDCLALEQERHEQCAKCKDGSEYITIDDIMSDIDNDAPKPEEEKLKYFPIRKLIKYILEVESDSCCIWFNGITTQPKGKECRNNGDYSLLFRIFFPFFYVWQWRDGGYTGDDFAGNLYIRLFPFV